MSDEWKRSGADASSGFPFCGSTMNFTSQIYGGAAEQLGRVRVGVELRLPLHPTNCKGRVMDVCVERGG